MVQSPGPASLWDAFRSGRFCAQQPQKPLSDSAFGPELGAAVNASNRDQTSAPRQFPAAPYVPFQENTPAYDITTINAQQDARNAAFVEWVADISERLKQMGYFPTASFGQAPENWYVQPVAAQVHIPGEGSERAVYLTLYHYDAWQRLDAAALALQLGVTTPESS